MHHLKTPSGGAKTKFKEEEDKMRANEKKISRVCLVTFLCFSFIFVLAKNQVVASQDEPKILSLSTFDTDKSPGDPAWKMMAKDLREATNGKIDVKIYYSEALGKAKEQYEMALNGVADICFINTGFTPGRFPLTEIPAYALLPSGVMSCRGMQAVMEAGCLDKEYANVKLLWAVGSTPSHFLWRKGIKAPRSLDELKGKKVRVPTTGAANLMKALGVAPIAMPMPEVYTSLERGVIDGVFTTVNVLDIFRLSNVCDQVTKADGPGFGFCLIMNKGTWNKLPAEAREVLDNNTAKYIRTVGEAFDSSDDEALKRHKLAIHDLSPIEKQVMKEKSVLELKKYIERNEELGNPARKAVEAFHQAVKVEYGVEPFILPK